MSLRKDHWIPMVHAVFPTHLVANHIYKRLLDHRAWRLTSPPSIDTLHLPRKQRNRLNLNQVPTSIADLAHVTHDLKSKIVMNWDRIEECEWAKSWNRNILHVDNGFNLRGYKLDKYEFPKITDEDRKLMKWDRSGEGEPPNTFKDAVTQSREIFKKMHPRVVRRMAAKRKMRKNKMKARKRREKKRLATEETKLPAENRGLVRGKREKKPASKRTVQKKTALPQ